MMKRMFAVMLGLTVAAGATGAATAADDAATGSAAEAVRAEAVRDNLDPAGRPLPLAAHWHRRSTPLDFQLRLIEQGHHLLPWLATPNPGPNDGPATRVADDVARLREMNLPIAFVTGGQWEAELYDHKKHWRYLPADQSPLAVSPEPLEASADAQQLREWNIPEDLIQLYLRDGKVTAKMLSPFGAVEPWREVGKKWVESASMVKFQELYPDPPLVLMISNNEASRLKRAEQDKRYLDKYGPDRDAAFKSKVVGDGWIERYSAMIDGMRSALVAPAWRDNSRFIAYKAFGPGLLGKSGADPQRVSWNWHAWEGGLASYYDNHWQMPRKAVSNVWSCQTESMNWAFQKDIALQVDPNFWLELIVWDGDFSTFDAEGNVTKYSMRGRFYNDLGFPPTPQRYRGWVQYGMWITQPRVVRGWRGSAHPSHQWWPRFAEVIRAVDLVHADPVLRRFWRQGDLVVNPDGEHPWTKNVPETLKDQPRWFHLTTSLDPARPWSDDTRMPVYTLARVIGESPSREWLVYAHGTLEDQPQVTITIPGYERITVAAATGGSFYHVKEADGSVTPVGDAGQVELAKLDPSLILEPKPDPKSQSNARN